MNLVDPVTAYPMRITQRFLEDGSKVRIAKRVGLLFHDRRYWHRGDDTGVLLLQRVIPRVMMMFGRLALQV